MRKNIFACAVLATVFILGCGGGEDGDENNSPSTITHAMVRTITIETLACKFSTDCGSTRSSSGEIIAKEGKQRWSTQISCSSAIEAGKTYKFTLAGYSLPANEVVFKFESASGQQNFGERTVELFGKEIVFEIIPTGSDVLGKLKIFIPKAGVYHFSPLTIEIISR